MARFPSRFDVVALAAGKRVGLLKEQIERFRPSLVSVEKGEDAAELRTALGAGGPEVLHGEDGLSAVASAEGADVMLSALVGAIGLEPTLAAIESGVDVALANKEVMVVAGELVRHRASENGVQVLPVDSEHNAIFQALEGRRPEHVRKLILTASGGPFRGYSAEQLNSVTREQALQHPTWDMGDKITIDSATLMNKGLEVIEARWFFDVDPRCIDVIIHPQSIVHSMVEYRDGSVIAVMAIPDMTIPIAHALSWPDLLDLGYLPSLDLAAAGELSFFEPDRGSFPCLELAFEALAVGGTMPAVANAANEIAVARFLANDLGFADIPKLVGSTMRAHRARPCSGLEDLMDADRWSRNHAAAFASA